MEGSVLIQVKPLTTAEVQKGIKALRKAMADLGRAVQALDHQGAYALAEDCERTAHEVKQLLARGGTWAERAAILEEERDV